MNSSGCGLGLALSNQLTKMLGPPSNNGILLESELNQGSLFYFYL